MGGKHVPIELRNAVMRLPSIHGGKIEWAMDICVRVHQIQPLT